MFVLMIRNDGSYFQPPNHALSAESFPGFGSQQLARMPRAEGDRQRSSGSFFVGSPRNIVAIRPLGGEILPIAARRTFYGREFAMKISGPIQRYPHDVESSCLRKPSWTSFNLSGQSRERRRAFP